MQIYASHLEQRYGAELRYKPGSGGAGGIGAALVGPLNATQVHSMDYVQEALRLEQYIAAADVIVTGEGKMDKQTTTGKVISRVCTLGKKHDKPVLAIVGQADNEYGDLYRQGLSEVFCLGTKPRSIDEAMSNVQIDLVDAAKRMMGLIGIGLNYGQ